MKTTVFPWVGGKHKLARQLPPLFSEHTCYVRWSGTVLHEGTFKR